MCMCLKIKRNEVSSVYVVVTRLHHVGRTRTKLILYVTIVYESSFILFGSRQLIVTKVDRRALKKQKEKQNKNESVRL